MSHFMLMIVVAVGIPVCMASASGLNVASALFESMSRMESTLVIDGLGCPGKEK